MKLYNEDLAFAVRRLPSILLKTMKDPLWHNKIIVGGGYLRGIVSGESLNDVDIFVGDKTLALALATALGEGYTKPYKTDNAYTIKAPLTMQVIHRWVFPDVESVVNSFDFTICCAGMSYDGQNWRSYCHPRFYGDLAAKRLVYTQPVRNEDAGGSMLRVLKYYQKGYRIPLDSLGNVMARMVVAINTDAIDATDPAAVGKVLTGMLREVDPSIDPDHIAHLPATIEEPTRNEGTMRLSTQPGDLVMVTEKTMKNGHESDRSSVAFYLNIGLPYTVQEIRIGDWETAVVLKEIPGKTFNSVNFVNCV